MHITYLSSIILHIPIHVGKLSARRTNSRKD